MTTRLSKTVGVACAIGVAIGMKVIPAVAGGAPAEIRARPLRFGVAGGASARIEP
jgi:hypothetical protein